uniref:Uncharacterized protein n=1 Tax=Oryza meridionalis TaxID=40149 RepID=A0A0E0CRG0_9ORYZ
MHDSENGCGAIGGMLGFTGMIVVLYSHLSQVGSARRMSSPPLIVWKRVEERKMTGIASEEVN